MPAREYIQYPIVGPIMDASIPPNKVRPPSMSKLVGVDGRYTGCLKKFYGMEEVLDLDDKIGTIDSYDGPSYFKRVSFQKKGSATIFHGFVIRYDKYNNNNKEQVDLVYTDDNGATWETAVQLWAGAASGTDVTSTVAMDCAVHDEYLFVCIEGQAAKVVYWSTSMQVKTMGPGSTYVTAPTAPTATSTNADHGYLMSGGTYKFAYRFYNSTRGIYSALSGELTVNIPEATDFYSQTIGIPANGAAAAGFDKMDLFRTINLGSGETTYGGIFYLEGTVTTVTAANLSMGANQAEAAEAFTGALDDALPFFTQYNPQTDIVTAPPHAGAMGRYGGLTFMAQTPSTDGGYDTIFSSAEHVSPEYFSTYNNHDGTIEEGRPSRYVLAGDSMFILSPNAVVRVYKDQNTGKYTYTTLHRERGLVGREAVHTAGNSIFMITGMGLVILNGYNGTMGQITAADRVIFDDWSGDLSGVKSGYDSLMNASFFLNPTDSEILAVWHSTQSVSIIEKANFVGCSSGVDIGTGTNVRAFFVTKTGLIVQADDDASSTGTMWGLDSGYTLDGVVASGATTYLIDTSAKFNNADFTGALVYATAGDNVGLSRAITGYDWGSNLISDGDFATGTPWTFNGNWNYYAEGEKASHIGAITGTLDYSTSIFVPVVGQTYQVIFTVSDRSAGKIHFTLGGQNGTYRETNDTFTETITATTTAGLKFVPIAGPCTYMIDNVSVKTYDKLTFAAFTNAFAATDRYAISPVPFKARLWRLRSRDPNLGPMRFRRQNMTSMAVKVRGLSGFTSNDNNKWRLGVYRNSATTIASGAVELAVSSNPADSSASLSADGIDLEPYIEQVATGVSFELTDIEVGIAITSSRKVTA